MTDNNRKQKNDQKDGVNPVAAAVTGAVVGAAVVGAVGAVILAKDDNRKKVESAMDEAKANVQSIKKGVEEKIVKGQEKAKEVVATVKDAKQEILNETK
jgi:F0F1-type ATP synthase membrane subunit b/b'